MGGGCSVEGKAGESRCREERRREKGVHDWICVERLSCTKGVNTADGEVWVGG